MHRAELTGHAETRRCCRGLQILGRSHSYFFDPLSCILISDMLALSERLVFRCILPSLTANGGQ